MPGGCSSAPCGRSVGHHFFPWTLGQALLGCLGELTPEEGGAGEGAGARVNGGSHFKNKTVSLLKISGLDINCIFGAVAVYPGVSILHSAWRPQTRGSFPGDSVSFSSLISHTAPHPPFFLLRKPPPLTRGSCIALPSDFML